MKQTEEMNRVNELYNKAFKKFGINWGKGVIAKGLITENVAFTLMKIKEAVNEGTVGVNFVGEYKNEQFIISDLCRPCRNEKKAWIYINQIKNNIRNNGINLEAKYKESKQMV